MTEKISINEASTMLAQGHPRMFGILKCPNGEIQMVGLGPRELVLRLDILINGKHYNEKTYNNQFICHRTKGDKPSWGVVSTHDWRETANSRDEGSDIKCIAFIDCPELRSGANSGASPLCFYACFNEKCNAIAIINDREVFKLWLSEADEIRENFQTIEPPKEYLERNMNDGRESILGEPENTGFYRY